MEKSSNSRRLVVPEVDITTLVLQHASNRGDRPALIDGPSGRTITYCELDDQIAALRGGLRERGFGRGDRLALHLPNCPEFALAFDAAASAGGAATTANPLYGADELGHQLEDSGAKILLTAPPMVEVARIAAARAGVKDVIVVGEAEGMPSFQSLFEPGAGGGTDSIDPAVDIAALPYSSGTTGLPKGVMLSHRNLAANLIQAEEALGVREVATGSLPSS
jgi:acyl-CoA synthetase (AMP-forming)/AMP-acid ligase II